MNNLLLAVNVTDPNYVPETITDKLLYGVQMLGIGMLTVFSVLITIWFSLVLFKWLFYDIPNRKNGKPAKMKKVKAPKKPKAPKAEPAPESAPVTAPAALADTALIAVITAAIMYERQKAGVNGGFRVVSFRRK